MTDQNTTSPCGGKATPGLRRTAARCIGGSLLASSDSRILQPLTGKHGTFQVRPLPELDTHALFLDGHILAMHPNGYSCRNLAERIIEVWEGRRAEAYALEQFDYILRCGGLGPQRGAVEYFARMGALAEEGSNDAKLATLG